jgi:hypothetical protein
VVTVGFWLPTEWRSSTELPWLNFQSFLIVSKGIVSH